MMQALIPVFTILGAAAAAATAAAAQLTLLPYAYLANPLPVYHQSQDTRTGVHAYSYAGGPSAKEEVRGLDGVTRGSYSYVDAHGILQSVFYVADENGFRVAATNLPTDPPLETVGEVLLAKYAHSQEHAKATAAREEKQAASRRKRSAEAAPADQDRHQTENPSSQGDQAGDRNPAAIVSPKSSHELPAPEEKSEGRANRGVAGPVVAPVYGLLDSVLIPGSWTGAATSHQSRVDVHNNVRLKATQPIEAQPVGVLSEPVYGTVILPSPQVPLAISHQSRVQVHNNLRAVPEKVVNAETVEVQPEAAAAKLELVSALPDYNENRIQLHKNLGLEGSNRKEAVKIDVAQLALVETPIAEVPVVAKEAVPVVVKAALPVVAKKALPVVTAVSSQSRTQIHRNTKLEVAAPIASEPIVYLATPYARPSITWPFLAPIAQSSQYRHQIHSNEKLELEK